MRNYDPKRVDILARQIMYHKRLYYSGYPEISDHEYDKLEQELKRIAPEHPVIDFVGTDIEIQGKKIKHSVPMLSLNKVYSLEELASWIDQRDIVGTIKVDGNSLSVVYSGGRLDHAKTRGNGKEGEDVTDKIRWVSDIIPELQENIDIEIRGELFCTRTRFGALCQEMAASKLELPTNPRNIVAGILGRKTHYSLARFFSFMAFDIVFVDRANPFSSEMERYNWLRKQGFILPNPELCHSLEGVKSYLNKVKAMMEEEEIMIDGAVFSYDELEYWHKLGSTAHHPRYKISFKWQGQTGISTVKRIEWSVSRLGVVTPIAIIDPINLSGAEITNVTLHNALNSRNNRLKSGDRIEIVRSGEVIPKFLSIVESHPGDYQEPTRCPSCNGMLTFDEVRLKCENTAACPAQILGRILGWIKAVGIDDLSEKRLEKMIELGLIKGIADLYRLTPTELLKLPATKEKMATKLYNNIMRTKALPLAVFLSGLGIEGTGLTSWEKLLETFNSLDNLLEASTDKISAIKGYADKSASLVTSGLQDKRGLIDELLAAGVTIISQPKAPKDSILLGKKLAITGKLNRPRGQLEKLIKDAGAQPVSAVSTATFALVTNDPGAKSTKMQTALKLGIKIWSEDELMGYLDQPK